MRIPFTQLMKINSLDLHKINSLDTDGELWELKPINFQVIKAEKQCPGQKKKLTGKSIGKAREDSIYNPTEINYLTCYVLLK